jgi:hypothetical protein
MRSEKGGRQGYNGMLYTASHARLESPPGVLCGLQLQRRLFLAGQLPVDQPQ